MASKVRQRDPCPCGSGRKYKNCCGRPGTKSSSRKWSKLKFGVLAIVVVVGGIAAYTIFLKPVEAPPETVSPELPRSVQPLQSQPPGSAPEGKVWSTEHGHWHDAAGTASDFATKFTPQPQGRAPEGKVWSAEHGHWHDESGTPGEFTPQPPGPAPEGKTWIPEHGHWHDASGVATPAESAKNPITITPREPPETGNKDPK